jgi:hypothetical protein
MFEQLGGVLSAGWCSTVSASCCSACCSPGPGQKEEKEEIGCGQFARGTSPAGAFRSSPRSLCSSIWWCGGIALPVPMLQQDQVVQSTVLAATDVAPSKPGKCWKCPVDTHATKDCKALHYCLVCDTLMWADNHPVGNPKRKVS